VADREVATPSIPLGLVVGLGLGHVAFVGNRFAFTLFAVALGASPLAIGALMGLLMVVPMVMAVHFGRWSDRIGYGPLALGGKVLLLASGLVVFAWPALPGLFVASALTGTGYMMSHIAVHNALGRVSGPERATHNFSAMALVFSASGLLGPLGAGIAIDHIGHRMAFLVLCVSTVASLVVLHRATRKYTAPRVERNAVEASVFDLLQHAPLRRVLLVGAVVSMAWDLFTFLAPLHGVRVGLSATATGLIVGVFAAGTFAIRLVLPQLVRNYGAWPTMAGGLFVTALGYVAFPLLQSPPALLAIAFLLGVGLGAGQPLSMTLLHMAAPAERVGEAVGVRSSITSASQTFLPMVFGALGTALGLIPVFWVGSLLLAFGGAMATRKR
jgi:MFS family permease